MSTTQHAGGIADEDKEVGPLGSRSNEVVEFCQRHAIESYLTKADELATRSSLDLSGSASSWRKIRKTAINIWSWRSWPTAMKTNASTRTKAIGAFRRTQLGGQRFA